MKKITAIISSFAMAASLAGCTKKMDQKLVSGEFTGTAKGNGGDVTVVLTLKDNVITDVKATGDNETPGIGTKALEKLPAEIMEKNSIGVDTVATATITSKAILEAAAAALTEAGLNPEDFKAASTSMTKAEDVTKDTDVVVIGAGGAGMIAAITAADAGKKVIIIESQELVGGNSIRSTGGMNATGTEFQQKNEFNEAAGVEKTLKAAKEKYADNMVIADLAKKVDEQWTAYQTSSSNKGYFDSVELMELDTLVGGKGLNNPELVHTLAAQSADAVAWLSTIGADLTSVGAFGGASVKRIHRPVNEEGKTIAVGAYVVPILEKAVNERGVEVLFSTTAEELLTDDMGKVTGVVAMGKTGNKVTVNAKSVVLASGGFGANTEMVVANKPELKGFATTNASGILGKGIEMAEKAGAATVDLNQIQIHPTVTLTGGVAHLITEGLRGDGAILVNAEGKRFTDEVGTRDAVSAAEIAQTNGNAWLVIDQKMVENSNVISGYIKSGYTVQGESVEELAKAMNVDAAAFAETMKMWNESVAAGKDEAFGRTSFANPLDKAPFYAINVTPAIHHTMGGVMINAMAEVLTAEGKPVAGLFAAGEVTGGVHGANRLGGNAVADFTVYGRIAGSSAAEFAK